MPHRPLINYSDRLKNFMARKRQTGKKLHCWMQIRSIVLTGLCSSVWKPFKMKCNTRISWVGGGRSSTSFDLVKLASHCWIITESEGTQSVVQSVDICSDCFGPIISIPLLDCRAKFLWLKNYPWLLDQVWHFRLPPTTCDYYFSLMQVLPLAWFFIQFFYDPPIQRAKMPLPDIFDANFGFKCLYLTFPMLILA